MKKARVMVGHGEGAFPKKSFELASQKKHDNVLFNAVDIASQHQVQPRKVPNLAIHEHTSSPAFLRSKAANSIHHQWSHFSASAMSMGTRRAFFREAFRTLTPGGKLVVIDGAMCEREFAHELEKAGFKVTAKRMTLQEIEKLGTIEGQSTVHQIRTHFINRSPQSIPKAQLKQIKVGWVGMQLIKEDTHSKEVVAQLERMADNVEKNLSDKPCTRIVATKPRN